MLKLKLDTVFHLCVKHPIHGTAQSVASVAMTNGQITVRDMVTDMYPSKHRVPSENPFNIQLEPEVEAVCKYYPDTNELGFIIDKNIQVCRDGHFRKDDKGRIVEFPEWRQG